MSDLYREYYKAKHEGGVLFQDFVVEQAFRGMGLVIQQYASRTYQCGVGESLTGVEIKYDQAFRRTKNFWIEVSEKANQRTGEFVESGVKRKDNTWLWAMGDYETIFFLSKTFLANLADHPKYEIVENNAKTGQGYLLPVVNAEKYALKILYPPVPPDIARVACELGRVSEDLRKRVAQEAKRSVAG